METTVFEYLAGERGWVLSSELCLMTKFNNTENLKLVTEDWTRSTQHNGEICSPTEYLP